MKGKVYITINLVNHKVYVGLTRSNNNYYIGSGSLLKKAFKKYGRKSFKNEVLRDNISSFEELRFWEDFYVKLYNSDNKSLGYNMVPGGMNGGWTHSDKALEKIRNRSNLPDNKELIRKIQKMACISRLGTHHSKKSKLKIVETMFGKIKTIEIYNKKTNSFIDSCNFSTEAESLTGVKRAAISNNLCGLSKSAGGYVFKYKN